MVFQLYPVDSRPTLVNRRPLMLRNRTPCQTQGRAETESSMFECGKLVHNYVHCLNKSAGGFTLRDNLAHKRVRWKKLTFPQHVALLLVLSFLFCLFFAFQGC